MRQCLRLLLSGGLVLSLSSTPCEAIGVGLLLDSDSVEHLSFGFLFGHLLVKINHGNLDHIGCASLYRCIYRVSLGCTANNSIPRVDVF